MNPEELLYEGEKFTIRWDPKEEVFFVKMWGAHTEKDAEEFNEKMYGLIDKIPGIGSIDILVDVSKQERTDHEARRIYTTAISGHPRPTNSVICGANAIIRIITNFIVAVATKQKGKNIKSLANAEEGLKWLRKMKVREDESPGR